jgi:hypothetical protein
MELALSIALLAGVILFSIGLIIVVLAGFKHHFFTGIIAMIPFLNIIILPSVWHRAYIGVYIGMIGGLLTLVSWYGGGNQYLAIEAEKFGFNLPNASHHAVSSQIKPSSYQASLPTVSNNKMNITPVEKKPTAPKQTHISDYVGDIKELPKQALYHLIFEVIEDNETAGLTDEYISLQKRNGDILEGKVLESSSTYLVIEHGTSQRLKIKAKNISKLEQLVKRSSN